MLESLLLATSVWVTPISPTANAIPVPVTVPVGLDSWSRPDAWSVPVYKASPTDARQPLLYNPYAWWKVATGEWQRSGNRVDAESDIIASSTPVFPYPGNVYSSVSTSAWQLPARYNVTTSAPAAAGSFFVPANAVPAPGGDGHMVVQQPDGRVLETYATIRLASGAVVALSYSVVNPKRAGDGYENGQTASMLPVHLGLLSEDELQTGAINHALAITVPAGLLTAVAAYPAYAFDRGALTENPPYSGALPMGARLALASNVSIRTLGLQTSEGRAIARAARRFGFIVADRGGGGISLRVLRNPSCKTSTAVRTWNWALQQDLNQIFGRLVMIPSHPSLSAATVSAESKN